MKSGEVIWITGLSGAGKSSLAKELSERLKPETRSIIVLDGDDLRKVFGATQTNSENYGRETRMALAMQYARLCKIIASQEITVIIATISLFHEVHLWNRKNLPGYVEIYLKVPLDELRRRDPNGIYKRFDAGEIDQVAGLDLPIDEPNSPDWIAEFDPLKTSAAIADELIVNFNWIR